MVVSSNKFSKGRPDYLSRVYTRKKLYEHYMPIDEEELKGIEKIERYKMVYTSNKIEGNSYTEDESFVLLEKGNPSKQKPFKDAMEISNLNRATLYCQFYNGEFNIDFIKKVHRIITAGTLDDPSDEGEYKRVRNWVGDLNTCPPNAVEKEMNALLNFYNNCVGIVDPILLACRFKYRFLVIHPFIDGNGRASRLLFNYILKCHGFIPTIVSYEDRSKYYEALRESNRVSIETRDKFGCDSLEEFMCGCLLESYEKRIYMLEGDFE